MVCAEDGGLVQPIVSGFERLRQVVRYALDRQQEGRGGGFLSSVSVPGRWGHSLTHSSSIAYGVLHSPAGCERLPGCLAVDGRPRLLSLYPAPVNHLSRSTTHLSSAVVVSQQDNINIKLPGRSDRLIGHPLRTENDKEPRIGKTECGSCDFSRDPELFTFILYAKPQDTYIS
jgi:hypothetical protein